MENKQTKIKVALVQDWLVSRGGAERVLKCFHEIWPEAPIYVLVYNKEKAPEWTQKCDIRTTYIQKWPGGIKHYQLLLSFMPKAWEALDLTEYDLIISSCSSCCKGILTRPDALHICYCHSPIRYVWDLYYDYLESARGIKRAVMPHIIHKVRMWDYLAAQRVDFFIANSEFVAKRIKKFYGRDSVVIHPGISINEGEIPDNRDDYYLVVSRFVAYKRIDLAINACNILKKKLIVIGSGGEQEKYLRSIAGPTIEFRGKVSDKELSSLYCHAKGLIFPGIEDFGLTPIEAMAGGCPVLAYAEGGVLETVIEGKTGLFFHEQSVDSLVKCINKFELDYILFSSEEIKNYAQLFSNEIFSQKIKEYISHIAK